MHVVNAIDVQGSVEKLYVSMKEEEMLQKR